MVRTYRVDAEVLQHALLGYQQLHDSLSAKILEIEAQIRHAQRPLAKNRQNHKGTMSAAGRAAVSAAQKRRWALAKKTSGSKKPNKPNKTSVPRARRKPPSDNLEA